MATRSAVRGLAVLVAALGLAWWPGLTGTAAAQGIGLADLAGTWRVNALTVRTSTAETGNWTRGTLTFDSAGAITGGSVVTPDGPVAVTGGSATFDADTRLFGGTIVTAEITLGFAASMTPSRNAVIGVAGNEDAGPVVESSLFVFTRDTGETFGQGHLAGAWRLHGLTTPAVPGPAGGWLHGTVTFGESGTVTAGSLSRPTGTAAASGGPLSVAADGIVTGTFNRGTETITLHATIVAGNTEIVGVATTNQPLGGQGFTFVTLVRQLASGFPSDAIAGAWTVWSLSVDSANANVGSAAAGAFGFSSTGVALAGGVVLVTSGQELNVTSGSMTVASTGVVSGSLNLAISQNDQPVGTAAAIIDAAAMRPSLTEIAGVVTVNTSNATTSYGTLVLVKDGQAPGSAVLTVQKVGNGTVTSSPAGLSCGGDCAESLLLGTTVILTASPSAGSTFAGWSGGGCSGTGTCRITLMSAVTVTATFEAATTTLSVVRAGSGSGTVTSDPGGIACGSTCSAVFPIGGLVTLTAQAAGGSLFTGWSGGGCSGTGTCVVTLDAATSVTAEFTATFLLTITVRGSAPGSVTVAPVSIAPCEAVCEAVFLDGTPVTLTATAGPGALFKGWSGACAGTASVCNLTMSAARSATATFSRIFDDPTLTPGATPVRAVHFTQLLAAINSLRAFRQLAPAAFPGAAPAPGGAVLAAHLSTLRQGLAAIPGATGFTTAPATPGTAITAAQLAELRAAVRALE
jgi:hypothetical protein